MFWKVDGNKDFYGSDESFNSMIKVIDSINLLQDSSHGEIPNEIKLAFINLKDLIIEMTNSKDEMVELDIHKVRSETSILSSKIDDLIAHNKSIHFDMFSFKRNTEFDLQKVNDDIVSLKESIVEMEKINKPSTNVYNTITLTLDVNDMQCNAFIFMVSEYYDLLKLMFTFAVSTDKLNLYISLTNNGYESYDIFKENFIKLLEHFFSTSVQFIDKYIIPVDITFFKNAITNEVMVKEFLYNNYNNYNT